MDFKKLFDMTGKVCIVTGAIGYLGRECAKALKDFGGTVVAFDIRDKEERFEAKEQDPWDYYVKCNVGYSDSIRSAYQEVYDKYGHIDVLVQCANGSSHSVPAHGDASWLEKMPDEVFEGSVDAVIGSCFRGTREIIPFMKEKGGSVVNFCSMYGIVAPDLRIYGDSPQRQPASYGAGKAAVDQFTRYAASDLGRYGIRVNSVTPGPFPNPRSQNDIEFNGKLAHKTMLERFGQSYEIAGPVLLLASDASSFMTGANVIVDGGWTAW